MKGIMDPKMVGLRDAWMNGKLGGEVISTQRWAAGLLRMEGLGVLESRQGTKERTSMSKVSVRTRSSRNMPAIVSGVLPVLEQDGLPVRHGQFRLLGGCTPAESPGT